MTSKPDADTDPAVANTEASDPDPATQSESDRKGARAIHPGDVLGRYEIGDELGEGGMATVFRARDRELRRDVAVKVLFPHLAKRSDVVRRFQREARAAAVLEHPNILRIYDVGGGTGDDPPFIVMELVRGRTLLQEVEQRPGMLAEIAACIGALLAEALAAAHQASIVHRDVKPSNVLIAPGGRLLLADFGVARLETEDSSLVTRTGALLGTPAYMSPEQASGDTATAKSDLYSLGATLYQIATGALPYAGSPAKVMSQIAAGTLVPPVKRSASVGPDLSRVIEQLMSHEATERPASAAAVAAELRQVAAGGGLGDPTEELAAYFADPEAFLKERTPKVVSALLGAGRRALDDAKLPRAIAIADRAAALAPEDPAVKTLVERVTEGDRASRRRRVLAIAGLGVLVAGGATAGALALATRSGAPADAAPVVIAVADAAAPVVADAASPDVAPTVVFDAPDPPRRDAGGHRAVGPVDAAIDAAPAVEIDAAPAPIDAAPAVEETGSITVVNDTWCEVAVDGNSVGRTAGSRKTLRLPVGHHVIGCSQPGINIGWQKDVDVIAGKAVSVTGAILTPVEVTIATAATMVQINSTHYPRGTVTKLVPGRYRAVIEGGAAGWLTIPNAVSCRLHEVGNSIVCDP
jgi:eukaryotic-like serine/threonine-protein kinase